MNDPIVTHADKRDLDALRSMVEDFDSDAAARQTALLDRLIAAAEVPEPRMDEPQETWATVAATLDGFSGKRVLFRDPIGNWVGCFKNGATGATYLGWSDLIDPRPTTPTERATGIVGGEDQ